MFSFNLHADIAPDPGTEITEEIEGTAASILNSYLSALPTARNSLFPPNIGSINVAGQNKSRGHWSIQDSNRETVTIACVSVYNRGRRAKCKLVKIYK